MLERYGDFTLVEADLQSGRTHQLRVHFQYIGHPVAGDRTYGNVRGPIGLRRQFVHACLDADPLAARRRRAPVLRAAARRPALAAGAAAHAPWLHARVAAGGGDRRQEPARRRPEKIADPEADPASHAAP